MGAPLSTIGFSTLQIIPSMQGFQRSVDSQTTPALAKSGAAGGKAFGGGMVSGAKGFAGPLIGVFAGALAAGAIIDFFKDAATAAMEDEKSVVALSTAMDNLGLAQDNAGIEGWIQSLMNATGVADEELRPAMQKLLTATGSVAKSQKLLSLAMDVSAGSGKDLGSVTQALARASNGQFAALTRLGVPLDANLLKSKDFAAITDVLSAKFKGQSAAMVEADHGLRRMSTAADEAKERVGYALLDAFDSVTAAIGGPDGAISAFDSIGRTVASFVTGVGAGITELVKLKQAADDLGGGALGTIFNGVSAVAEQLNPLQQFIGKVVDYGQSINDAKFDEQQLSASWSAAATIRHAYAGDLNVLGTNTRDVAYDTEAAKQEMDDFKAAISAVQSQISASQAYDDFRHMLKNIGEELKGNSRNLKGNSDAAYENRTAIRTAFTDAKAVVQSWVDSAKIAPGEFEAKFNGLAKRIVKQLTDDGFKEKDLKQFLGPQNIWTDPAVARIQSAVKSVSATALTAATAIGTNLAAGVAAGLDRDAKVAASANRLIMEAKNAMKQAGVIKSPSQLTMREVGEPLAEGVAEGIRNKTKDITSASSDAVAAAAEAMLGAMSDKAGDIVARWDDKLDGLKDVLDDARSEVTDWASHMRDSLLSGFDIAGAFTAAIGKDGKLSAEGWIAGVDQQIAGMEWFSNVLNAVRADAGVNGQALMDYLASKGAAVGGAMGQALIDNGLVQTMADKLALVQSNADTMAAAMVPPYLTAGVDQAQAMYDGFKANFGAGGPARIAMENLMDRIAQSLGREVTVNVRTVYDAAGIDQTFMPGSANPALPSGSLDMASAEARAAAVAGASTRNADVVAAVHSVSSAVSAAIAASAAKTTTQKRQGAR